MKWLRWMLLLFCTWPGYALGGDRYFISFRDKEQSPYTLENPEAFLSARAIQRRAKQGIPIRQQDLPVSPIYLDGVEAAGMRVLCRLKWLNGAVVEIPEGRHEEILAQLPFVNQVKPVRQGTLPATFNKFDKNLGSPVNLRLPSLQYGNAYNQVHMIACDYLHQAGFDGTGMVIALLDAGFERVDVLPAFDSLRARNGILGTWDFVDGEPDVYNDHHHGMNVLSCIASNIPGTLIGTAPGASFYLLRTETTASETLDEEYFWAAGAEFADSAGADILSTSLGYTLFDDTSQNHSYSDMNGHTTVAAQAANHAASAGMLVVASAGNNGAASWNYISTPADADSALAIGAVNAAGAYAFFSSNGPSADGDVKPNVAVQGSGAWVYFSSGTAGPGNGTSFAAPILAGAAACLWQAFDTLGNMDLYRMIEESANRYPHPDTLTGYGIPNFMSAYTMHAATSVTLPAPEGILQVYPVPWQDRLHVIFNSTTEGPAIARIMDALGREVFLEEVHVSRGLQEFEFQPRPLRAGVYFFELTFGGTRYVKTLEASQKP